MHTKSSAALCAAIITAFMALGAITATARNLSVSNQNIRLIFSDIEWQTGGIESDCHVTLEGSFHERTIAKTPNGLLGYITDVRIGECSLANTILTETLPWHIKYVGFSGRLPSITLLLIRTRYAFRWLTCSVNTEIEARFLRDPATAQLREMEIPAQELPISGFLCPESLTLRSVGSGRVYLRVVINQVTVTLI